MATVVKPVDAAWAERNLGIVSRRTVHAEPSGEAGAHEDTQRLAAELIEYDSEGPEGEQFRGVATAAPGSLSQFVQPEWPKGLEPRAGAKPDGTSLPEADVLVVTWTVDEGHALARVLTPGFDSRDDWQPYTKNYAALSARMSAGCPAREKEQLGGYWTATVGGKRVTLFKSDSHMSQDGPSLPNADVWKQIIEDCRPSLVLTTGTGGGIGPDFEVGDVIVSRFVSFDCQRQFKHLNGDAYLSAHDPPAAHFAAARALFEANAGFLPPDNTRKPEIVVSKSAASGVLTTDFFGFDNSANTYGLQGKGDLSEMGDAVLGLVCKQLGAKAPAFAAVRNVSDPQIASAEMTLQQQTALAGDIYKAYGVWSTVCSAITCWAIIAAL